MLDLPASGSELIETFVELTKGESNPFKLASLRAQLQIKLVREMVWEIFEIGITGLLETDLTGTDLIRDEFNTRKMIVAVTDNGKVTRCITFRVYMYIKSWSRKKGLVTTYTFDSKDRNILHQSCRKERFLSLL